MPPPLTAPPMTMKERGTAPTKPGRKRGQNPAAAQAVRERLLAGDALTRQQVEDEYNVANGFLLQQVRWLEREGHQFESSRVDGLPGGVRAFRLKAKARPGAGRRDGALPRGPMPTGDNLPPVVADVSKREQISDALMKGHRITSQLVKSHWDTDPTMLGKAVRALEVEGIEVQRMKAGATKVYFVTNTQKRARVAATKATHTPVPSSAGLIPVDDIDDDEMMAPAPHLGQQLTVFLTALDDDGEVVIGLRNGSGGGSWQVRMLGYVPDAAAH